MRGVVLLLLSTLASCDFVYSVRRTTPVGREFSAPAAEQWACEQPGHVPDGALAHPWDGESMAHEFQRGLGRAWLELGNGEVSVTSSRIGPPGQEELDAWLQLQSELVTALRKRFPSLPPASEWRVTNTYLDDQLAAAAGRAQLGEQR